MKRQMGTAEDGNKWQEKPTPQGIERKKKSNIYGSLKPKCRNLRKKDWHTACLYKTSKLMPETTLFAIAKYINKS